MCIQIQAKDADGKTITINTPKGLPKYCYGTSRIWNQRSYGGSCSNCK